MAEKNYLDMNQHERAMKAFLHWEDSIGTAIRALTVLKAECPDMDDPRVQQVMLDDIWRTVRQKTLGHLPPDMGPLPELFGEVGA